jgi:hypothetical protein
MIVSIKYFYAKLAGPYLDFSEGFIEIVHREADVGIDHLLTVRLAVHSPIFRSHSPITVKQFLQKKIYQMKIQLLLVLIHMQHKSG